MFWSGIGAGVVGVMASLLREASQVLAISEDGDSWRQPDFCDCCAPMWSKQKAGEGLVPPANLSFATRRVCNQLEKTGRIFKKPKDTMRRISVKSHKCFGLSRGYLFHHQFTPHSPKQSIPSVDGGRIVQGEERQIHFLSSLGKIQVFDYGALCALHSTKLCQRASS